MDTTTEGMTEKRGLLHEEKQLYLPERILRHILPVFGEMTVYISFMMRKEMPTAHF